MVDFDENSVRTLETLCRISCTPEERKNFLENIRQVLDYVEELESIDTTDVEPCSYVLKEMQNTLLRKDEIGPTLSREEFLANACEKTGGMIRIPPVFSNK